MNRNVTVALGSFILLSSFVYAKSSLCEPVCGRIQETTKSSWLRAGAYMTYEQLFVWSMHNETDYMTWNITRFEGDIADLHLISHGVNVTDGNVTLTTGDANLTINVSTREVINCSDLSYVGEKWPFWIEQNVTWGSEIDIWYGTSIIGKDEQIHILGEERDCWVVEYNWTTACMKRWYDKTSGIVLKIHVILYHENITIATTETAILTSVDLPVYRSVHNLDTRLNYTTIQQAIDANETSDGHTIFVEEGTYYESVVVNKSISLVGENKTTTIIDGNYTGNAMNITASNVCITCLTIQKSRTGYPNAGIYVDEGSDGNNISYNIMTNNYFGIRLFNSSNNSVYENEITNNTRGIGLRETSKNSIYRNNITNNYFAVWLYRPYKNRFFHNNFVDNTQHVNLTTPRWSNFWDDGVEGNYWSNYTGADLNHDGIGDTWHMIDQNNTDHFPLMGMFSSFNTSLSIYVNVISNSTINSFEYFEANSAIRMYVSYESPLEIITFGFCRVCIPYGLMNVTNIEVMIDDGVAPVLYPNYTLHDNTTHRWIYFAYEHTTHKIDIIPEFPTWTPIPLTLIILTIAMAIYKRRLLKTPAG